MTCNLEPSPRPFNRTSFFVIALLCTIFFLSGLHIAQLRLAVRLQGVGLNAYTRECESASTMEVARPCAETFISNVPDTTLPALPITLPSCNTSDLPSSIIPKMTDDTQVDQTAEQFTEKVQASAQVVVQIDPTSESGEAQSTAPAGSDGKQGFTRSKASSEPAVADRKVPDTAKAQKPVAIKQIGSPRLKSNKALLRSSRFRQIFTSNFWGSSQSRSGAGSEIDSSSRSLECALHLTC